MCIYFGNCEDLTYKNQEHVFPAGLGGIKMLDHGVVSDQANKLFSPLELKLMRNSLVSFPRIMYGPGKRGSLSPTRATKSAINVALQENGHPILCYTANGKPYSIPQFHRHIQSATISIPDPQKDYEKQILAFLSSLECFSGKYTYLKSDYIPHGDILIGFIEGTYYVATRTEDPTLFSIQQEINNVINNFQMAELHYEEQHVRQLHHLIEDPEAARMYAKIAINTIALRKGSEYASHANFAEIRNWILTGQSNTDFYYLPSIQPKELEDLMKRIPTDAHWCIFTAHDGNLEAFVCLYNCYLRSFTIGKLPEGKSMLPDGYICDWRNKKELTIFDFVQTIAIDYY